MLIGSIVVEASPTALEYDPSNNNIYVANYDSGKVIVLDPRVTL